MEPIKVTFKFKDKTKWTEITLMRALGRIGPLNCIGIFIGNTQVTFHLSDSTQLTPFLTASDALDKIKLELIESPEVTATRTIFAPRVQDFIANMDKILLAELINESNNNLEVDNIIFVGSATSKTAIKNNLKIVFKNPNMAKQALQEGIWIDNFEIRANNIQPEEIIRPPQCNKCLKLDHVTKNCRQKNQTCSRCAGNHAYNDCDRNRPPYCINCKGAHSALYASCPAIKNEVNQIRRLKKYPNSSENQQNQNATAQPSPTPPQPPPPPPTTNAWFQNTASNTYSTQAQTQIPEPKPQRMPRSQASTKETQNIATSLPTTILPNQASQPTTNANCNCQQTSSFNINAIQLQYDAYHNFAKEATPGNPLQYLTLMNIFFKQAGLAFRVNIDEEIKNALKTTNTQEKESQTIISQENYQEEEIVSGSESDYETESETNSQQQTLPPLRLTKTNHLHPHPFP